ncbi:MAG: cysteine--tRNA ligase [Anaerolineae bacterium]
MLQLYNTLTRQKEPFTPWTPGRVSIYTCGPTVYRFAHIGNLRSFLLADWLRRVLEYLGYQVTHVVNITDVGHMRQEMLELGEDRVIAAARAEGKSPQEIAEFYTAAFHADEARLNILPAHVFPRASQHIPEMIAIVETLLDKGLAYEVEGTVYYDVTRFPSYGQLSGNLLEEMLEGVRVAVDPHKRHPEDFTLWKAAEPGREMKWPSPWGEGFPGWHIECSAMSMKYLGPRFDIHTGGVDNIFPHHEDEIAQSEGATGEQVVRYWVHGQHLLVDGLKMAKSTGNDYTLADLEARGYDPLAFRYLCLTVHYRTRMNFTFPGLDAAQAGLNHLRQAAVRLALEAETRPERDEAAGAEWRSRFVEAIEDDLGLPQALSVVWDMLHAQLPSAGRWALLQDWDRVLGLGLADWVAEHRQVPAQVQVWVEEREAARARRDYARADALRHRIAEAGFQIEDTPSGPRVLRLPPEAPAVARTFITRSDDVPSQLDQPDGVQFSVNVLAHNNLPEVVRCVESVARWSGGHSVEIILVDNGSVDDTGPGVDALAARYGELVRVFHADHHLGEGAGRNVGLRASRGTYVVLLDVSAEVTGDLFTPLAAALADPTVGVVGPWGLRTDDLREWQEHPGPEVDAMQAYCFAFRRALLREVGWLDEKFRFYRHLDLDFSLAFRDRGYRILALPDLPLARHEHTVWERLVPAERERLSKRNYYRFLKKWGDRRDLLVSKAR